MTCPACRLENIPSARCCDCGQSLVEIVSIKRFARTFTVKHVFEAWGIGAAFVMTERGFLNVPSSPVALVASSRRSRQLPWLDQWPHPRTPLLQYCARGRGVLAARLAVLAASGTQPLITIVQASDMSKWRYRRLLKLAQNGTKCDAADQPR